MQIIAICVAVALLPIAYFSYQAWSVTKDTTKLSRQRHQEMAAHAAAAQKRRPPSGPGAWWRRLTGAKQPARQNAPKR